MLAGARECLASGSQVKRPCLSFRELVIDDLDQGGVGLAVRGGDQPADAACSGCPCSPLTMQPAAWHSAIPAAKRTRSRRCPSVT